MQSISLTAPGEVGCELLAEEGVKHRLPSERAFPESSTANDMNYCGVGIPIVNDLNGLQSEPTYRLFGGVLVGF